MQTSAPRDRGVTRRGFLAGAGAAAAAGLAGCMTTGLKPGAGEAISARKVRIGVCGGGFGCSFYWHLHPDCEVGAVTDLRPDRRKRLQEVYRCSAAYPSLTEMLKDRTLDAVAIFTEAPNHVPHTIEALDAGKHVICAVPAAMTLEECHELIRAVERTGLTFMMAETSYYRQEVITARRWFQSGEFGDLFCTEAEYHHDGLESLFWEGGKPGGPRTWRYGFPPMHYPTHSTAMLVGVTGERLREVTCLGWGDADPILKDNAYANPFWSETAFFKTSLDHAFRCAVYWKVAAGGCERAKWYGDKKSFHMADPNGLGPVVALPGEKVEPFAQPEYWRKELPEPLRIDSGHGGSHTFLTHEFVRALKEGRRPAIDVYEAVAYTAPGIVAHQSALKGGESLRIHDFGRAKA